MRYTGAKPFTSKLVTKKKMSAKQYLNACQTNKNTSSKARFVTPKVGGSGFGYFEVELQRPHYEVVLD